MPFTASTLLIEKGQCQSFILIASSFRISLLTIRAMLLTVVSANFFSASNIFLLCGIVLTVVLANTDGADTIRSSHIHFDNWTVYSGDDSISLKANSTDITITNSKFYNGLGVALGSIGQYNGEYETIERLMVRDCYFDNTLHALYFKTWTDDQNGYPPNGGGGGLGCK